MTIDINSFEEIKPAGGGRRTPALTLGRIAYFRGNRFFIKEHGLDDVKSVKLRAVKEGSKILVAINFLKEDEGNSFKVSFFYDDEGEIKSLSFSGRSIFSQFNLDYKDILKSKSILLKPTIQEHDGEKYFVIEIPLENQNEF